MVYHHFLLLSGYPHTEGSNRERCTGDLRGDFFFTPHFVHEVFVGGLLQNRGVRPTDPSVSMYTVLFVPCVRG